MNNKIPDFSIVPTGILSDKKMTFRALKVYMAIKAFMNKDTQDCFPSRQLIAEMTDIPVTRISVETERLEQMGWIKKTGTGGRSMPCVYTVFSTQQRSPSQEAETVTEMITVTNSETVTELDETVTELSGNGYRIGTKTVTKSVTGKEQTKEQTKNKPEEQTILSVASGLPQKSPVPKKGRSEKAKDLDLSSLVLPDWLPKELWQQFTLHRERMKKPMSVYAAEIMIGELNSARANGWSPEELLKKAITDGYQGCVYDKHKQPKPTPTTPTNKPGVNNGYQPKLSCGEITDRMFAQFAINQSKDAASHSGETGRVFSGVEYSVEGRGDTVDLGIHDQPVRAQVG